MLKFLFPLSIVVLTLSTSLSQVPQLLEYDGYLLDASNKPVTGNISITVRLYDNKTGGNIKYSEWLGTIPVKNGEFYLQYGGAGEGIVRALNGTNDWLAIFVNGAEQSPRSRLLSVPFALKSSDAQELKKELESLKKELRAKKIIAGDLVPVTGGVLPPTSKFKGQRVRNIQVGKYEVTRDEWNEVAVWGRANGYVNLPYNPNTQGKRPITVGWLETAMWCNAKSEMENLMPVYLSNGKPYKTGFPAAWGITTSPTANGYRIPKEIEWEWAARGGTKSKGYIYSGGNDPNTIGWHLQNSNYGVGNQNIPEIGQKNPNELGLHDMSGNVEEWCENNGNAWGEKLAKGGSWDTMPEDLLINSTKSRGGTSISRGFRYIRY